MPRNPDRSNLCHFTYADGRRCTLPQFPDDMGLCYHHREKRQAYLQAREAGRQVARFLHTNILTACDLSCTLSALFDATAQGYIKPKVASTLAYIAQLMLQAQERSKLEYTDTFVKPWEDVVSDGPAFTDDESPDEPDAASVAAEPSPIITPEPSVPPQALVPHEPTAAAPESEPSPVEHDPDPAESDSQSATVGSEPHLTEPAIATGVQPPSPESDADPVEVESACSLRDPEPPPDEPETPTDSGESTTPAPPYLSRLGKHFRRRQRYFFPRP